jgi:hypothetical protein
MDKERALDGAFRLTAAFVQAGDVKSDSQAIEKLKNLYKELVELELPPRKTSPGVRFPD